MLADGVPIRRFRLGWEGHALAIGVTWPEPAHEDGEPPEPREFEPIPDASHHAAELLKVLRRDFRYAKTRKPRNLDPEKTERGLTQAVDNAIRHVYDQHADALIVHVLTHGERKGNRLLICAGDMDKPTVDVGSWLSAATNEDKDVRPHALFILDFCHAGHAARNEVAIGPIAERRVWIIAATGPDQSAFDGRLTKAVTRVLANYRSGMLTVDESAAYIPFGTFTNDIQLELNRMYKNDLPQEIETSYVQSWQTIPEIPFFANPYQQTRGDNLIRDRLDLEAQPLIDTVPYEPDKILNYVNDSAGSGSAAAITLSSPGHIFVGRSAELRKLSEWLDDDAGAPVRVVTGKPGVGKSALLGIIVCAAHPRLRQPTYVLWQHLNPRPSPQGDRFCAVHARGRAIDDIADGLARQLGLGPTERTDHLIQRIGSLDGRRPVIVIDAVDEAADPPGLVKALLYPLAAEQRSDGTPVCRLLIGCRREDWLGPLIQANDDDSLIDLGETSAEALHRDISTYLEGSLEFSGPYAGARPEQTELRQELVQATADALAGTDGRGGTPEFGEFLVAGLFAQQLRASRPVRSRQAARSRGAKVPRALIEVLDLDLAQRRSPWLRPLLVTVAHAYGDGLPDQLIRQAIGAMRWGNAGGPDPTTKELRKALEAAEFYLRRSVDTDGRTLYRIFHQGLADRLCAEPPAPGIRTLLFQSLTREAIRPGRAGLWRIAPPYLLRHAARHAADAGRLDDLLADPDFLVHADPVALARELHHARSPEARRAASIHRVSYAHHYKVDPESRRQILAVDAARFGESGWVGKLTGRSPWRIAWATGGQASPALAATLTEHPSMPRAVACATIDDRVTAIVAAGNDAYLWDLATSQVIKTLTGHTARINAVAIRTSGPTAPGHAPVAVTASSDGTACIWDLETMTSTGTLKEDDGLNAVALATVDGRDVVIIGGNDETATVWDLASREALLTYYGHDSVLTGIASAELDGTPLAVTTSNDGTAQVWDLETGETVAEYTGHRGDYDDDDERGWVRGVAVGEIDGVPVAVTIGNDGTDHVWDIRTGERKATHSSLRRDSSAGDRRSRPDVVSVISLGDGRSVAVTGGADGTAHVWDLAAGEPLIVLAGHTEQVTSVAGTPLHGGPAAVTSSDDGTVRVWDLAAGLEYGAGPGSAGHTGQVRSVALTQVGDRPAVASASADTTVMIWDLASGTNHDRLTGHTRGVNALAAGEVAGDPVLVSGGADKTARVWNLTARLRGEPTGAPIGQYPDPVIAVACSGRPGLGGPERSLAVAVSNDEVHVWDLAARELWTSGRALQVTAANALACADVGAEQVIVRGSEDSMAEVWNPVLGESVRPLTGHDGPVLAVACAVMNGQPVAVTGSADRSVLVHDLTGTRPSEVLTIHDGPVRAVACSDAGGRGVAFTASGCRVRVSDLSTGQDIGSWEFPYEVSALCASPAGEVVIAAGHEIVCMVWSRSGEDEERR